MSVHDLARGDASRAACILLRLTRGKEGPLYLNIYSVTDFCGYDRKEIVTQEFCGPYAKSDAYEDARNHDGDIPGEKRYQSTIVILPNGTWIEEHYGRL